MRSTFRILFYINKSKIKADGTTAILCRITIDGANVVITTGESTNPHDWSMKRGETTDKKTNQRLQAFREEIEQGYNTLLYKYGAVSAELLKNHLQGIGRTPTTLLALSSEELKAQRESKSEGTYSNNRSSDRQLNTFVRSRGEEDIPLTALATDFFDDYRFHLKKEGYAPATINGHLCWLSRLMYRAVSQGTVRFNPFEEVKYEAVERKPRFLSKGDVAKLLAFPLQEEGAELSRRMFLFSVFTGLAFADLQSLRASQIETNSEGKRYIRKARQKTEVESLIPLHPIVEQILSLYTKENSNGDYKIFPDTMSDWKLLSHLKAVGLACGIRTPLTWHCARHTFGTLTLEAGVPIESIAKMMGHSSIASTQIYAQVTDQKIAKDMERLIILRNVLKSEFRKSNGAVTTPEHIVHNTIDSTVPSEYLESLTNQQILDLKFLDPACGSGVFLISIYDHLATQIESNLEKRNDLLPQRYLYEKDGKKYLNLEGRKLVVNQCLYGVDINPECVEVTKLSLSLKTIEGFEPGDFNNVGLYGSRILHGVGVNIKCGNSLVESDILERIPSIRKNIEEFRATNVFDYKTAFSDVFSRGGFDYVIGNPPYVEVKNYNVDLPCMSTYIKQRYGSSRNGKIDLAIPFIERGIELLNEQGSLGYIVQKRFFKTEYGKGIRKLLSNRRLLRTVYDYVETDLFEDRITYVAIIVCDKSAAKQNTIKYTNSVNGESFEIAKDIFTEMPWSFENHQTSALRIRLANELGTLGNVCKIKVGVQVLWTDAFHIVVDHTDKDYIYGRTALCENLKVERGACRVLLCNEHFVPLSVRGDTTYILFPYDVVDGNVWPILFSDYESRYPLAARYLRKNRTMIEDNVKTVPDRYPTLDRDEHWHLFTRANNHNAVYKKLCIPMTTQNPQAAVVMQKDAYCDNANMFFVQIPKVTDDKLYALAAVINSTPFAYFAKSIANPQQGEFYKFNKQFLDPVPFPCVEFIEFSEQMQQLARVARHIEEANTAITTSTSSASRLYPLLNNPWNEVDRLCCELYRLSNSEKEIIMSNPRTDHYYE